MSLDAFQIRTMTQADAEAIALWHYPEPFSFYDWSADADDLAELLSPTLRGEAYFAVDDGNASYWASSASGGTSPRPWTSASVSTPT